MNYSKLHHLQEFKYLHSMYMKYTVIIIKVCNFIFHSFTKDDLMEVAYPGIFFGEVQQIQLRTEGRENGNLGAVAP
jgi:hypothetical protein